MGSRSRKHKKRFACEHRGFGRYCHRCAATQALIEAGQKAELLKAQDLSEQLKAKQLWKMSNASDRINLTHLPKAIVLKARQILQALSDGTSLHQLKGKRFHFERHLIRIPVTYRYRLLCWQTRSEITPLEVLSHEAYNAVARGKRKVCK